MLSEQERLVVWSELRQRLAYPYIWPSRQTDAMDKATKFIYHTSRFDDLLTTLATYKTRPDYSDLFNYALNRWYNFWSSQVVESLFCSLEDIRPAPRYDRTVDFFIRDIPFDHKTTVFPRGYGRSLDDALAAPQHFAHWLYTNQSSEGRYHTHNRLFIVLHADDGEHWRLKADVPLLADAIETYIEDFDPAALIPCVIGSTEAMADIIWVASEGMSQEKVQQRQRVDEAWARFGR